MKKTYIVLLLMLATAGLYAQSDGITLRFSANHTCSFAELDSVVIENLTQGGSTVLHYPDTVITFITTDIHTPDGIHEALYVSQNYPNPFSGKTNIDMYVPGSDLFYINVYDLTGRIVAVYEKWLEQGMHHFAFYGCNKQTYVFTVSSRLFVQKRLMIQLGGGSSASSRIIYKGQTQQAKAQPKSSSSEFGFHVGDELRFTGYATDGFGDQGHEVITDTPVTDQDYLFDIANFPPEQPSDISGEDYVPVNATGLVYEVEEIEGLTYLWTVPEGWEISEGQGSHSITLDAGSDAGDISVKAENNCGMSEASVLSVDVYVPTFELTLSSDPPDGGDVSGAGSYQEGEEVGLTATANQGWEFVQWTGDTDHMDDPLNATATVTIPAGNVTLTANFQEEDDYGIIYGDGVSDIDGNEYITVIIGDQEWMAENLRVTRYRNGVALNTGLDNTEWANTTEGAYAIYDYDAWNTDGINSPEEMVAAYGKLYNWYAVDDSRGICPEGWSVPSHDEWTQLEQYICNVLGNSDCETQFPYDNTTTGSRGTNEGGALKSCRQVNSPAGGDCDTSEHPRWASHATIYGFDAFGTSLLPGGYRWSNGSLSGIGYNGTYWTSSEYSSTFAWYREANRGHNNVHRTRLNKGFGFNVRCIRDTSD